MNKNKNMRLDKYSKDKLSKLDEEQLKTIKQVKASVKKQLTKDTIIVETISAKNYTVIGIGGYTEEKPYIDIFFGKNMIELEYE
mgnify:CR=1 FL=1